MPKTAPSRSHDIDSVRLLSIMAHIDAGKTTLTERLLFVSGRIHRVGEVHDGMATMDFLPEEQNRGITIESAVTGIDWQGTRLTIIDTPGHVDFTIEVERSLRVVDGAVAVFCGVAGVEPQSETVWRQSEKFSLPKLAFINKLDRMGADFDAVVGQLREQLGARPLVLTAPLGQEAELSGVMDVLTGEALTFDAAQGGRRMERAPLAAEPAERRAGYYERLVEDLAEHDDELLAAYLEGRPLDVQRLRRAVAEACRLGRCVPVFAGSALKNIGIQPLLDGMRDYLPSPLARGAVHGFGPDGATEIFVEPKRDAPLAALAFKIHMEQGRKLVLARLYAGHLAAGSAVLNSRSKSLETASRLFYVHADEREAATEAFCGDVVAIMGLKSAKTGDTLCDPKRPVFLERIEEQAPVVSLLLEPRHADEHKPLAEALVRFAEEDPTLRVVEDEGGGFLVSGMGELHLEIVRERLAREYHLSPWSGQPRVVLYGGVGAPASAEARFDREMAGAMQHGAAKVSLAPLGRGEGRRVVLAEAVMARAAKSAQAEGFAPAWLEGVRDGAAGALESGGLQGLPVTDIEVRVDELPIEPKQATALGLRLAARQAVRQALAEARPCILEPIMLLTITVAESFTGDVAGLLGKTGARIEGISTSGRNQVITAVAPMRELFGFPTALRSASQGRAGLDMRFFTFGTQ